MSMWKNQAVFIALALALLCGCVEQAGQSGATTDRGDPIGDGGDELGDDPDNEAPRLKLSWQPNPPAENILGYAVFYGPASSDTSKEISRFETTVPGFNAAAPSVVYDLEALGLQPGDQVCVRIKAFNNSGDSGFSSPTCSTI